MKSRFITFACCLVIAFSAMAVGTPPKYIFYFIGDGMGMGHIMAAQTYNRTVLNKQEPLLMMQFPVSSFAMTYSHQNPVTDSAAAGTALATGVKTRNGMIGMTPDSTAVTSIARQLKDKGYGIAIVTSVPPDDATPSVFYAHQPHRSMYYEIGKDMAASDYDFFAGGELRGLKDKSGKETDLKKILNDSGYTIVRGTKELNKIADHKKVILLNDENTNSSQIGFTIDSVKNALTLPEITRQTIAHLKRNTPDAFFAMIEGGNIDYGGHSNDGATTIKEILNFNEALAEAYNFYLEHPHETLIVVTADHDTGGMTIGVAKGPKKVDMSYIDYQKISKDQFSNDCRAMIKENKKIKWNDMKKILTDKFGLYSVIKINKDQEEDLKEEFEKTFIERKGKEEKTLYNSFNEFVLKLFYILDHNTGFGWTTTSHTGNPVPVFAIGVGAEEFGNVNNNTDIPKKIHNIAGIED